MDKQTAKKILAAYRPDGRDSNDREFEEALRIARHDPDMASWLSDEIDFDEKVATAVDSIPVSSRERVALESLIDIETRGDRRSFWRRPLWQRALATAAALVLALGLWGFLSSTAQWDMPKGNSGLTAFVENVSPLDLRSNDWGEINRWLAGAGVSTPVDVESRFENLSAVGCKVYAPAGGGKVALLCFQDKGKLVHLLVLEGQAAEMTNGLAAGWNKVDGWNLRQLPSSGPRLVLATRTEPSELDGSLQG